MRKSAPKNRTRRAAPPAMTGWVVPLNDFKRKYRENKKAIDRAIKRVLESGWFILGPEVKAFEESFAKYLGARHAIGVHSGTDAIAVALMALGVKAGDDVITVAHTATPTIAAIRQTGATPVFVDIDEATLAIDPGLIEAKITARTKAIVPVHLYGHPADMSTIMDIAGKHRLAVVEDCAQASGASWRGKKLGTWGTIGAFSFYSTKNLGTFGDGGAAVTDDPALAERMRRIRQYGESERYKSVIEGINSRLQVFQAAILNANIPHLDRWNRARKRIAARYQKGLAGLPLVLPSDSNGEHVWHLFVVRTDRRDALKSYLADYRIETGIHYPTPVHLQEAYRFLGYKKGDLPVTEKIAGEILSLPISPELTATEQQLVIKTIRQFFAKDEK